MIPDVTRLDALRARRPLIHCISNLVTANDWLTRDPQIVAKYNADPFCTFIFTVSAYHDFFTLLTDVMKKKDLDKIPAELPVLFISGAEDPVGGYAKGVEAACRRNKPRRGLRRYPVLAG